MLLDFGTSQGLAYRHNYQQDIANLHTEEQLDNQAQRQKAQQIKEDADSYHFGTATNEFYKKGLTDFTNQKMNEIGSFVNQNPDHQYNLEKTLMLKQHKDQLVNNEWVANDQHLNSQIKNYQDWIDKNPGVMTDEERAKVGSQIMNEKQYGDIGGLGQNKGKFMFVPPAPQFDQNKMWEEIGKNVAKDNITDAGSGMLQITAKDENVNNAANGALLTPAYRRQIQLQFNNEPDTVKKKYDVYGPDGLYHYSADQIRTRIQPEFIKNEAYLEALRHQHKLSEKDNPDEVAPFNDFINNGLTQIAGTRKPGQKMISGLILPGGQTAPTEGVAHFNDVPINFTKAIIAQTPQEGYIKNVHGDLVKVKLPSGIKMNPVGTGEGHLVNGKFQPYATTEGSMTTAQLNQMFSDYKTYDDSDKELTDLQGNPTLVDKNGVIKNKDVAAIVSRTDKNVGGTSTVPMYNVNIHLPFDVSLTNAFLYNKSAGLSGKNLYKASAAFKNQQTDLGNQPKVVNSQAEFNALPSGATFIDSSGQPKTKK